MLLISVEIGVTSAISTCFNTCTASLNLLLSEMHGVHQIGAFSKFKWTK